jgi:hypothetical protein
MLIAIATTDAECFSPMKTSSGGCCDETAAIGIVTVVSAPTHAASRKLRVASETGSKPSASTAS